MQQRSNAARGLSRKWQRPTRQRASGSPSAEIITLYDSHGIQPEMVKDIAAKEGAVVDLPDNFYSIVADQHSESKKEAEEDKTAKYAARVQGLPPTKKLYYEQPSDIEFEAVVLDFFDNYAVLDQTLFYPEGGGQPADTGTLVSSESMVRVDGVVKVGEVILHHVSGGMLSRGDRVKGMVDEERRWSLMRHHTATHILLHATKEILGAHIHQAGAQKGSESSRVDIRHFKHITPDELHRIEVAANRMIMANQPVEIGIEDRGKAEQKYGFSLYQGGVPPGQGHPHGQGCRRHRGLCRYPLPEHRGSRHHQDHPGRAHPGRYRADRVCRRYCCNLSTCSTLKGSSPLRLTPSPSSTKTCRQRSPASSPSGKTRERISSA